MHIGSVLLPSGWSSAVLPPDSAGISRAFGLQFSAGTIGVTILAGPLNYTGVHPDINCTVRHPSN